MGRRKSETLVEMREREINSKRHSFRRWTAVSKACYERGCVCKDCEFANTSSYNWSFECKCKETVMKLVKYLGAPPKTLSMRSDNTPSTHKLGRGFKTCRSCNTQIPNATKRCKICGVECAKKEEANQ